MLVYEYEYMLTQNPPMGGDNLSPPFQSRRLNSGVAEETDE